MFCLIVVCKVFCRVLCTRGDLFLLYKVTETVANCVQVDFLIHCCCFPMIRLQITIPVTAQLTDILQYVGVFQADSNSCDLDLHGAEGRGRHGSAVSGS